MDVQERFLIIHWLFSSMGILLMAVRLVWRKLGGQNVNLGDYLTMAAIFCGLTRTVFNHVILIWGTNNMHPALRESHKFTEKDIYQRTVGSKLSFANKFTYSSYLWIQKLVMLDICRRLMADLRWEKATIRAFLAALLATYVAILVVNFSECRPIHLHWQVVPDPGPCATTQAEFLTLAVLNVITDLMLLLLPIPVVMTWKACWVQKIKLGLLFTLGIFIIAITLVRLPLNFIYEDDLFSRSTFISLELMTVAAVVNAPTLCGLWNSTRRQKASQRYNTALRHDNGDHEFWHANSRRISPRVRDGDSYDVEVFPMEPRRGRPIDGIVQTKNLTVLEVRSDDLEHASINSSQRGILRD